MNRSTKPNPSSPDYVMMSFQLASTELAEWKKTGLDAIPSGWRPVCRFEGDCLVIGIEPMSKEPPKKDKWSEMSDADLKSMAGRKGVTYDETTTRQALIEALRSK